MEVLFFAAIATAVAGATTLRRATFAINAMSESVKNSLEEYRQRTKAIRYFAISAISVLTSVVFIQFPKMRYFENEAFTYAILGFVQSAFLLVAIIDIVFIVLLIGDDNWFNQKWKKFKRWVKNLRFGFGNAPKFA